MLKKIFPKRILWRIFFIIILPMLLLQMIIGIVFYKEYIKTPIQNAVQHSFSHIHFIEKYIEENENMISDFSKIYEGYYKIIPQKKIHFKSCKMSGIMSLTQEEIKKYNRPYRFCKVKNKKLYRLYIPLNKGKTFRATYHKNFFLTSQWHFLPVWSLAVSIFLSIIIFIFLKNQMRPVIRLGKAAKAFGNGNPDYPLHPSGAIEIKQTINAFSDMRHQIKEQMQSRSFLLAGISHDLRTILTHFSLEISMMDDGEVKEVLQEDIKYMKNIIDSYLDFTAHNQEDEYVIISPKVTIEKIIEIYKKRADITFDINMDKNIKMKKQSLNRILLNLMDNAVRYGDKIHIHAKILEDKFYLCVEDNGKGVSVENYTLIFQPFMKLDPSLSDVGKSSGLGLALVKDIVQSHGGEIWADKSSMFGGLKISLSLQVGNNDNSQ